MTDQKLEEIAKHLNLVSTGLSAHLERIQQRIGELGLGVEAWIATDRFALGYGRWRAGNWLLMVKEPDKTPEPLLGAARSIRVEAVKFIPELLTQLRIEAEAVTAAIQEAIRLADATGKDLTHD